MLYKNYLKSKHWQDLKSKKLKKKAFCFVCGSKERLIVHHLRYKNLFDIKMIDLKIMCWGCHERLHKIMGRGFIDFGKTNHKAIIGKIRLTLKGTYARPSKQ